MNEIKKLEKSSLIVLTLDMGASISKAFYSFANSETHFMKMDSEMLVVPEKMLSCENLENVTDAPEHSAWIKLKAKDKNVIIFGLLAKKFQAMKENQIYSVKYENALVKCLAFIGSIIKKHNLNPLQIDVEINLLIPYDEFNSRKIIQKNLQKSIGSFYFQDVLIQSRLMEFECYPEGYGGFIDRVDSKGIDWLRDKKIAVIMVGHRNCSCLIFKQGSLFNGETIRTGYFDFIKDIKNNSIGQSLEDLEFLVPKVIGDSDKSENFLNSLVKANNEQNQKVELIKIKSAINNSREKFWYILSNWLNGQIPNNLHEIMIFGGASQCFQEELKQFYSWSSSVYWANETAQEIQNISFNQINVEDKLSHRFVDVFGLHKHRCDISKTQAL